MTTAVEQAQKKLDDCLDRREAIDKAIKTAKKGIAHAKYELEKLEAGLPAMAARMLMDEIVPEEMDNHFSSIEEQRKGKLFHEAAFAELNSMAAEALKESSRLNLELTKQKHLSRFHELKAQLLERFDSGKLEEARRAVYNAGLSGPHCREFDELLAELKKRKGIDLT